MAISSEFNLVIAACDADGGAHFIEAGEAATFEVPGAIDAAYFWGTDDIVSLPAKIGAAPSDISFPGPGGSKLSVLRFPAHSAGKLDSDDVGTPDTETGIGGEADMHRSNTIDYDIILSGKVDIVLAGGQVRTLTPGSILIMAGAPHAWRNHYDEDCTFVTVLLGAEPPGNH
jgi:hypothetical protein